MNLTLNVWRQANADAPGRMERYDARDVMEWLSQMAESIAVEKLGRTIHRK